ncbi:hypothetical protein LJR230_003309 [Trinickia sp. LjRoot230]
MGLVRPGGERGGILLVIAGLVLARAFDWLWIDPLADSLMPLLPRPSP